MNLQGASLLPTMHAPPHISSGGSRRDLMLANMVWMMEDFDKGFDYTQLQGASFGYGCVWRADARQAAWKDTKVTSAVTSPQSDMMMLVLFGCDSTAASFAALKQLIAEKVPGGENKRAALERIEQRLDPTKALDGEDEMVRDWTAHERASPAPDVYAKSLAGQWQELGCAEE